MPLRAQVLDLVDRFSRSILSAKVAGGRPAWVRFVARLAGVGPLPLPPLPLLLLLPLLLPLSLLLRACGWRGSLLLSALRCTGWASWTLSRTHPS